MSNTRILYILIFLALASIGGRWWMQGLRKDWEKAVVDHERGWERVWATSEELAVRREKAPKGPANQRIRTHFQTQAFAAHMGAVEMQTRTQKRNSYEDQIIEVSPADNEATFDRQQLRLFLFNSELEFPRMRTTAFGIQPVPRTGRSVATGAERDDRWRVTKLEFRHRTPVGGE